MASIRRLDPAEIELVRPLWESLLAHHGALVLPMPPARTGEDSWRRRHAQYVEWLAEPDAFALVAEADGEAAGYALVRMHEGNDTWRTGDRVAELETLAVAPGRRGEGVGGALMDAVERELDALGIEDLIVAVATTNEHALRFYSRRGLAPYMSILYRRG